jgi:hypothetical protein
MWFTGGHRLEKAFISQMITTATSLALGFLALQLILPSGFLKETNKSNNVDLTTLC